MPAPFLKAGVPYVAALRHAAGLSAASGLSSATARKQLMTQSIEPSSAVCTTGHSRDLEPVLTAGLNVREALPASKSLAVAHVEATIMTVR
jgi:hypothetical protein